MFSTGFICHKWGIPVFTTGTAEPVREGRLSSPENKAEKDFLLHCHYGRTREVELAVQNDPNIAVRARSEMSFSTGLMRAAWEGQTEVVRVLLELPNAEQQTAALSAKGWNSLMYCCRYERDEIARLLLELPNARNQVRLATPGSGNTPLRFAISYCRGAVPALLAAHGQAGWTLDNGELQVDEALAAGGPFQEMLNALLLKNAETEIGSDEVRRISLLLGEWPALASLLYAMGGQRGREILRDVHKRWFPRVVNFVAAGKQKLFCQRFLAGYEKLQNVPDIDLPKSFELLKKTAAMREARYGKIVNGLYQHRSTDKSDKSWSKLMKLKSKKLGSRCLLDVMPHRCCAASRDGVVKKVIRVARAVDRSFQSVVKNVAGDLGMVHAGPVKSYERTKLKCKEYEKSYKANKSSSRWSGISKRKLQTNFSHAKFSYCVMDTMRASIAFNSPAELLQGVERFSKRKGVTVLGLKNGFSSGSDVPPSGYRHVALYVEVKGLQVEGELTWAAIPIPGPITWIGEVQFVLKEWLQNKKATSFPYKIRRASNFKELGKDMRKYCHQSWSQSRSSISSTKSFGSATSSCPSEQFRASV